jgi:hypothetical protein
MKAEQSIEQDAARYRWLRDQFTGEEGIAGNIDISLDIILCARGVDADAWPHAVDVAIDAAMREEYERGEIESAKSAEFNGDSR